MKYLLFFILTASGAISHAKVAWGVSTQNQVYCYPANEQGVVYPNALPVKDAYCFLTVGAEWDKATNGEIYCFPKKPKNLNSAFFNRPISNFYCAK